MADDQFKIEGVLDASGIAAGAQEGRKELGALGDETKQVYDKSIASGRMDNAETAKAVLGKGELRAATRLLGYEFQILSGLARLFYSPVTAAMGVLLVALRVVKNAFAEIREEAKKAADAAADAFTGLANIRAETAATADEAMRSLNEALAKTKAAGDAGHTAVDRLVTDIKAQETATLAVLAAQEKLELAKATTDAERDAVRNRFEQARGGAKTDAEKQIIDAKNATLAEAERMQPALEKWAREDINKLRSPETVAETRDRTFQESRLKELDVTIAADELEAQKKVRAPWTFGGLIDPAQDRGYQAALAKSLEAKRKLADDKYMYRHAQARVDEDKANIAEKLRQADESSAKAIKNAQLIAKLGPEVEAGQKQLGLDSSTAAQVSGIDAQTRQAAARTRQITSAREAEHVLIEEADKAQRTGLNRADIAKLLSAAQTWNTVTPAIRAFITALDSKADKQALADAMALASRSAGPK